MGNSTLTKFLCEKCGRFLPCGMETIGGGSKMGSKHGRVTVLCLVPMFCQDKLAREFAVMALHLGCRGLLALGSLRWEQNAQCPGAVAGERVCRDGSSPCMQSPAGVGQSSMGIKCTVPRSGYCGALCYAGLLGCSFFFLVLIFLQHCGCRVHVGYRSVRRDGCGSRVGRCR